MHNINNLVETYLSYCLMRKRLDPKTVRAYRADLADFSDYLNTQQADFMDKKAIGQYVDSLHRTKAPRTVKRKIASLQAFYHFLVYEDLISDNPLYKIDLSFKLPQNLPRYIPTHVQNAFYHELYAQKLQASTDYQYKCAVRNIAVVELLFATGLRISELCNLTATSVNLTDRQILIHGKGNKERVIQLTEDVTINALVEYETLFRKQMENCGFFFISGYGNRLSDQSVRNMIHRICMKAEIPLHITPHMFRHSFATSLVNQDVDIRCIQEILGHSSIKTTEIYTHVDMSKQKSILESKNPRKLLNQIE